MAFFIMAKKVVQKATFVRHRDKRQKDKWTQVHAPTAKGDS